jgi:hypothetical protein
MTRLWSDQAPNSIEQLFKLIRCHRAASQAFLIRQLAQSEAELPQHFLLMQGQYRRRCVLVVVQKPVHWPFCPWPRPQRVPAIRTNPSFPHGQAKAAATAFNVPAARCSAATTLLVTFGPRGNRVFRQCFIGHSSSSSSSSGAVGLTNVLPCPGVVTV